MFICYTYKSFVAKLFNSTQTKLYSEVAVSTSNKQLTTHFHAVLRSRMRGANLHSSIYIHGVVDGYHLLCILHHILRKESIQIRYTNWRKRVGETV
jgi:hypothetical protein